MRLNQFKNGDIAISKALKARLHMTDGQAAGVSVWASCPVSLNNLSKQQIQYT
jgi:hypothetical protein